MKEKSTRYPREFLVFFCKWQKECDSCIGICESEEDRRGVAKITTTNRPLFETSPNIFFSPLYHVDRLFLILFLPFDFLSSFPSDNAVAAIDGAILRRFQSSLFPLSLLFLTQLSLSFLSGVGRRRELGGDGGGGHELYRVHFRIHPQNGERTVTRKGKEGLFHHKEK